MILEKMEIKGFKSFKQEQTFVFGKRKGVYFLAGNNDLDKTLGSNGAGKSSIWDALCWVLYGKTVRGLKAGDLLNWASINGGYSVKLFWEGQGSANVLYRSWNPNKTELTIGKGSTEDVDQKRVDEVFGIPYTPFLFSVLMGQGKPMFFDLKESDKSLLFSEIFQLNKWIELSEKALKDSKELESKLLAVNYALSKLEGSCSYAGKELKTLKNLKDNWRTDKGERIREALQRESLIRKELDNVRHDLRGCIKERELLKIDLRAIADEIKHMGVIIYKTEDRIKNIGDEMVQAKGHIRIKKEDEAYFRKYSKGGMYPCTLCGQSIQRKYATDQIKSIRKKTRELGLSYHDKILERRTWKVKLDTALDSLEALEKESLIFHKDIGTLNSDISFAKGTLNSLEKEMRSHRGVRENIESDPCPFNKDIRALNSERYYAKQDIMRLSHVRKSINEKGELTEYWVKGFKDIRLCLISDFLLQLELEVNSALGKLGLPGWQVSFDIERETKSKTIKKGFHVMIHSPLNAKPVPWELWSGGESQRLRLAGNMGLSALILSQYGVSPNVEIWDEPSSHLGKEGVSDLLETLYDRSQTNSKCLWLIEHNNVDFGNFAATVTVVKTDNGSVINV